jgi:uncharacterized protein
MAKRYWSYTENPKNRRWYITIQEGAPEEGYPTLQDIKDGALEKGIDSFCLVSDTALEKNLHKALDFLGEEHSFPVVIEPTFDVRLIVSPDKTSAALYIRKAADRRIPLDLKLISSVLNASHLKGMDSAFIKEKINSFRDSPAMELNDFVIARGQPPGRGEDRTLFDKSEWLFDGDKEILLPKIAAFHAKMPQTDEDRIFPIADAQRIARVEQHQIVYELTPAEQGTPGIDVYGKEIPGLPGNDPFILLAQNISIGASGFKAEKGGLLLESSTESGIRLRIIPYADGNATPIVSADNMSVSLILESEEGAGEPLTATAALDTLAKQGIQGKIDRELIEKTIDEVRKTKKSSEIVILKGKEPVPPGSSRIAWVAGSPLGASLINIQEGDKILSAEKVSGGADGCDVYGAPIKASSGKEESVPEHDDTIAETKEGETLVLTAKRSGCLILAENKLSISDSQTITGDVDDKTGDIHFPGNLTITGTIRNNRAVKASGTLAVSGDAEAALVSAETNVTMTGGIKGAGRGTVWAKQEIHIAFAENARLLAGQDITVNDYCFQCTVKTNGTLFMKGNPAVLLGGNVRASRGVEVYELGSEKTIRTSISFGQNYLVSDQIEVCEKEVQKIGETVGKIDAEMSRTSTTDPAIHELRRKKLDLLKRNDKLTVRIFTLKEQYETHIISHVRVENTVYPGVILESHGRYFEVREQRSHVIFIFDQTTGQIVCNPIDL